MAVDNDKKIMRGEFRGDFTRDTFDPMKAFSRVLMQQGRVQLDADWNEQVSILLHGLRNFNCDIGGPHWGPKEGAGFEITVGGDDFTIGAGHYYVNGILCELEEELGYEEQVNYPVPEDLKLAALLGQSWANDYLVYLDVWERHISFVEDNALREVALGGPDTATRAQIIWQVKVFPMPLLSNTSDSTSSQLSPENYAEFLKIISEQTRPGTGRLSAKLKDKSTTDTPCLIAPESRYRGLENQLYRVEIHLSSALGEPTFKWSRDNGAVIFPVTDISGSIISLETLGQDCRSGLKAKDWVEVIDDDSILCGEPGKLVQIIYVNSDDLTVTVNVNAGTTLPEGGADVYKAKHLILRRWDHNTGDAGIPVTNKGLIDLEDGIQIQFPNDNGVYQTGDYWLIPARTATDEIEWPEDEDNDPKKMLPHGVIHHYAPLAIIKMDDGKLSLVSDSGDGLRRINKKELWEL